MMLDPKKFLESLNRNKIDFATGVPDSLLKDVCAYITDHFPSDRHIIATNEGSAIGLAIGHYLSTARPALVYMQNSGLGNTINPLTSLADPKVYGIPMILMIGWRGEVVEGEQIHDEPQHKKQGLVTLEQLDLLDIPFQVIDANSNIDEVIDELIEVTMEISGPVALVVRKGTFEKYKLKSANENSQLPTRESAIEKIVEVLPNEIPIVSTTGMASRELFEIRKRNNMGHQRDFLTVGGMGHALQIATGIALNKPSSKVVCIDGDGALLMHTGG
ncbi:MAG: phosphonopyruvate decarboxylase, partial [Bdellovibrionales bacterium]|nr:phosphonopyruvate decarboxylase [Bdellovibrionales bacterium]